MAPEPAGSGKWGRRGPVSTPRWASCAALPPPNGMGGGRGSSRSWAEDRSVLAPRGLPVPCPPRGHPVELTSCPLLSVLAVFAPGGAGRARGGGTRGSQPGRGRGRRQEPAKGPGVVHSFGEGRSRRTRACPREGEGAGAACVRRAPGHAQAGKRARDRARRGGRGRSSTAAGETPCGCSVWTLGVGRPGGGFRWAGAPRPGTATFYPAEWRLLPDRGPLPLGTPRGVV